MKTLKLLLVLLAGIAVSACSSESETKPESPTFTVSGKVTGAEGVTISLTGDSTATATAGADGSYSFAGLANGSYTLTPSKTGYSFSPASVVVYVNGADVAGQNFTAVDATATYKISGTITGATSVTVTLTGAASLTTTTGTDGSYSFSGLANGDYTVTPSKSDYTFNPTSLAVSVNGADATGKDFAATAIAAPTYSISGNVTGATGVTMTLSGDATGSVTTASDGSYSFSGLANGSYTVTPSKSGYSFSPANLAVAVNNGNATGNDFSATLITYTISGTITGATGTVTVNLGGAASASATADGSGNYSFTVAPGTYTVTPSATGYAFTPASKSVSVTNANVTGQDFTAVATHTISGTITGATGVSVALSGDASLNTTTDGSGNYAFTVPNGSYTITPSKSGYSFSPANRAVAVNNGNATGNNFTATLITYTISGTITGVTGTVTVTLGGAESDTTTPDGSGSYSFTVAPGTYTVTPSAAGHVFTPANKSVTVTNANVTGQDFTAEVTYTISGTITGASSVSVVLSGDDSLTDTTDGSGNYAFTVPNGNYTVTPSLMGYTFDPSSKAITVAGADVPNQDFTATLTTYTISGTITGASGSVSVNLTSGGGGTSTTTDGFGNYSFDVPPGTYTVTPVGDTFSPAYRDVTVTSGNVTGQDFTVVATVPSYSISGTVTYTGTKTGRVYLRAGDRGTSITLAGSPGSYTGTYTIRGFNPGSYTVSGQMDTLSTGENNANNPRGGAGTTITSANVTGVNFTLSDPPAVALAAPSNVAVFPSSGGAFIAWDPLWDDASDMEKATAYKIYWGATSATADGNATVTASDDGSYFLLNLANGSSLYVKVASIINGTESAASAVVGPVTVGAPGAGTLTGSITLPSDAVGKPMIVGAYQEGFGIVFTTIAAAANPQSYTITGVPNGAIGAFAIVDVNEDGVWSLGDIHNAETGAPATVSSGSGSVNFSLSAANASAMMVTDSWYEAADTTTATGYFVGAGVYQGVRRPATVTLVSGNNNLPLPIDIGKEDSNYRLWNQFIGSTSPTVGDTYTFEVTYTDGTSETLTAEVTTVLGSSALPQGFTIVTTGGGTAAVPLFQWAAPASPPAGYSYLINTWGAANWWYEMPGGTTSVLYGTDGADPASLAPSTAYSFRLSVVDSNGNMATVVKDYSY